MPSLFDQAFEVAAAPAYDSWFGESVQLRRGPATSDAFTAYWSRQSVQAFDEKFGIPIEFKFRVYRFLATNAVIEGVTVTPRAGDIIVAGSDEYKILPQGELPAVEEVPGAYRWLVRTNKLG